MSLLGAIIAGLLGAALGIWLGMRDLSRRIDEMIKEQSPRANSPKT